MLRLFVIVNVFVPDPLQVSDPLLAVPLFTVVATEANLEMRLFCPFWSYSTQRYPE